MFFCEEPTPLHGAAPARQKELEFELYIALTGIDDVSMQSVHAIHSYTDEQIRIDHHFEDTLIILDNGEYAVDMTKFDAVVPDSRARDSVRP
jgi:inward rectifier potassium channel